MRGRKTQLVVTLSPEERHDLESRLRRTTVSLGLARRCRAVLAVADGESLVSAGRQAGMTEKHVRKWVRRYLDRRLDGLADRPGRGRKPAFSPLGGPPHRQDRL
jgi:Helix-turn-helix domain